MNIKFVLPALLVLCGAACMSPVHAADYRCMVFSGSDGGKPEASSNADGKYAIKAADLKAAEAGALAAATRYKKNSVTLTKAQCDAVAGASSTATSEPTAPAPAPSPAPAPAAAGGGTTMYCMLYDGPEFVSPPAALQAEGMIWRVPAKSIQSAEDDALVLAKAQGKKVDSAMCEGSVAAFKSESY
jgi:hypothetical protein